MGITVNKISNQTNKVRVDITVMDSPGDLPALQDLSFPYRRICITAKSMANDPGATIGNWAKYCYRIYVRLRPKLFNICPDPWAAAAAAAAAGLPPPAPPAPRPIPCPARALQALTVIGAGQLVDGWVYYISPMRDGTAACAFCDRVDIAVLSDPGIPNGASVGPITGGPAAAAADLSPDDHTNMIRLARPGDADPSTPETAYLYARRFRFQPSAGPGQLLTFRMCVTARGVPTAPWGALPTPAPVPPPPPPPDCFNIRVDPPAPAVHPGRTDFGAGAAAGAGAAPAPLYVRCSYTFTLVTYETKEVWKWMGVCARACACV